MLTFFFSVSLCLFILLSEKIYSIPFLGTFSNDSSPDPMIVFGEDFYMKTNKDKNVHFGKSSFTKEKQIVSLVKDIILKSYPQFDIKMQNQKINFYLLCKTNDFETGLAKDCDLCKECVLNEISNEYFKREVIA